MKNFIYSIIILLIAACNLLLPLGQIQQASANEDADNIKEKLLTSIEKKYAGKSFETSFKQVSTLTALDMTETAAGKACFSHPGKMYWEYLRPEKQKIITNGKFLWIYRPLQGQVLRGEAEQFLKSGAGGAFLADIALIRKNYIITVRDHKDNTSGNTGNTNTYSELKLIPKARNPNISQILIRLSKKTNDITQVTIHNTQGDTNLFDFTDIRFKTFDDSLFEFIVPDGVNIVELNQY